MYTWTFQLPKKSGPCGFMVVSSDSLICVILDFCGRLLVRFALIYGRFAICADLRPFGWKTGSIMTKAIRIVHLR